MTAQARSVNVTLSLDTSQAIANVKQFGAEIGKAMDVAEGKTRKQAAAIDDLGDTSGKMALAAAAGFLAIETATVRFEKQMSSVDAATHETAAAMEEMRGAALQAGADTAFSATEAAAGIENLAKAGVSTSDILDGGLTGALDLAAAGSLGVADAAEYTATALTQFQLDGSEAAHVADLLAAGAGKAQGEVSDMALALNYAGVPASNLGVSIEETAGSVALLAKNGIVGEQAGTSLRGMLASLTSPSAAARNEMKRLGISVFDARGEFVGFDGIAGQLQDRLGGLTDAERANALGRIFGNEQLQAANVLYREGADGVTEWATAVDDQGFAADTAARKMDNLAGDIEKFTGALETAFIGAGDGSQDALRGIVQNATDAVDTFTGLPDPIQETATALLGLTAITGGAAWLGTRTIRNVANTRNALEDLGISGEQVRRTALRGGVAMTGFALEASGAADAIGLTNSASLAMMGTIAGPWGAAIGGGAGMLMDFYQANQKATDATDDLNAIMRDSVYDFDAQSEAISAARARAAEYLADVTNGAQSSGAGFTAMFESMRNAFDPDYWINGGRELFGLDTMDEQIRTQADAAEEQLVRVRGAVTNLAAEIGNTSVDASGFMNFAEGVDPMIPSLNDLTETLRWAAPAMDALGYSAERVAGLDATGLRKMNREIVAWHEYADTGTGRTETLANAFADVAQEGLSAADAAKSLSDALDAILGPAIGVSEANDQWTIGLRDLTDDLSEAGRELRGNSDAALENRDAIRDRVTDLQDVLVAEAEAGAGSERLARILKNQRGALLDAGEAAGVSREDLRGYLNTLGLTPSLVRTIIDAVGADQARGEVAGLNAELAKLASKTITVTVNRVATGVAGLLGSFGGAGADGMTVPGQRTPYGDKVLIWAAPGEEIITNRHGEADQFRADRAAGLIPAYADGGTAGDDPKKRRKPTKRELVDRAYGRFNADIDLGVDGIRSEVDELRDAIRDAKVPWTRAMREQSQELIRSAREYERLNDTLEDTREAQRAFRDDVAGSFDNDIFGNGVAGLRLQLEADRNDSRAMETALAQLKAKGLDVRDDPRTKGVDESAFYKELAASGDLTTAQQLAGMSRKEIRELEKLYASTGSAQASLGNAAASDVYGRSIKTLQRELRQERREFKEQMETFLSRKLPKTVEEGSYRGTFDGIMQRNRNASQMGRTGGR
jgi:TP901 family phage tail tape measure protein